MDYQVYSAVEWLYPDSAVSPGGKRSIDLAAARGGRAACQILLRTPSAGEEIRVSYARDVGPAAGWTAPEVYELEDVMVERNTGDFGFVLEEGAPKPDWSTRQAPFRTYDAMRPLWAEERPGRNRAAGVVALYVVWRVPADASPGTYVGTLAVSVGNDSARVPVAIDVYPATVPAQESLSVTNWFNLGAMASRHGIEPWSEPHWDMIGRYARLMRSARQTHFWVPLDLVGILSGDEHVPGYSFDWYKADQLIRMFLDLGFSGIESGHIAHRAKFEDAHFLTNVAGKSVDATSIEAYDYYSQFFYNWHHHLARNGWLDMTVQHVGDEPTVAATPDYQVIAGMVRKFMPGVPIIDAVERSELYGSVDIWVPKNDYYEKHREEFEAFRRMGDTIWFYTCCIPGGRYCNRLMDMALVRSRLLHWGNYLYNLPGFLHWGFNMYRHDQDPFELNCPEHPGPTHLPPGDTHLVYPGPGTPWPSVRLEAMGAGAEDYELFRIVAERDAACAAEVMRPVMRGFADFSESPAVFEQAHRRLLAEASVEPY